MTIIRASSSRNVVTINAVAIYVVTVDVVAINIDLITVLQIMQIKLKFLKQRLSIKNFVHKKIKIDKYEKKFKSVYNFFIRQLKKRFKNENITINLTQTFLKDRPNQIGKIFTNHYLASKTLIGANFKIELLIQLGNLNNFQRFLKEKYLNAVQRLKKTVLKFVARLNKYRENLSEIFIEKKRIKMFRHDLKFLIKNKINV